MIAGFIKKVAKFFLGPIHILNIDENKLENKITLDHLGFNFNFFDQFDNETIGERRDINRINSVTKFHSDIINNQSFEILSPFHSSQISSKISRAPFLSTFHSILFHYKDKEAFSLIVSDY